MEHRTGLTDRRRNNLGDDVWEGTDTTDNPVVDSEKLQETIDELERWARHAGWCRWDRGDFCDCGFGQFWKHYNERGQS
jgi:hypothetical protein